MNKIFLIVLVVLSYQVIKIKQWTKVITAYSEATFQQTQCNSEGNMKDKLYFQCSRSASYWKNYESILKNYTTYWK